MGGNVQAQKQFDVTQKRSLTERIATTPDGSPLSVVVNTLNGLKARQGEYAKKRIENLAR
jgi:hypothetical protein